MSKVKNPKRLKVIPTATTNEEAASERACQAFAISRLDSARFATELGVQAQTKNIHWASVFVIGWVIDTLIVGCELEMLVKEPRIVKLSNLFSAVME